MKRRSARPFTVEVKHTRASLTDATARSRKSNDLWRGLPLVADDKLAEVKLVQPVSVASPEAARLETPARRVLPSLVPTFSMPVAPAVPEVPEAPAVERLPRVRRVKPLAEREPKPAAHVAPAPSVTEPQVTASVAAAGPASHRAFTVVGQQPASVQAPAWRTRQQAALRPGERWKRRLPRVLW